MPSSFHDFTPDAWTVFPERSQRLKDSPGSTTSWWLGLSRAELNAEAAKRFAHEDGGKLAGITEIAQQANQGRARRKGQAA